MVFRLIPREERFFDLFEEQARNIVAAAARLREMIFDFSDARRSPWRSRKLEHAGDVLTHDLIRKINTTFVTPFDREDVYALASRLDDVRGPRSKPPPTGWSSTASRSRPRARAPSRT